MQYFEGVERVRDKTRRIDLLRIAWNESNLNRMVRNPVGQRLIIEVKEENVRMEMSPIARLTSEKS